MEAPKDLRQPKVSLYRFVCIELYAYGLSHLLFKKKFGACQFFCVLLISYRLSLVILSAARIIRIICAVKLVPESRLNLQRIFQFLGYALSFSDSSEFIKAGLVLHSNVNMFSEPLLRIQLKAISKLE